MHRHRYPRRLHAFVSMKSGLEGRNNAIGQAGKPMAASVSMKSGLEGRNNPRANPETALTASLSQ